MMAINASANLVTVLALSVSRYEATAGRQHAQTKNTKPLHVMTLLQLNK